MTRGTLTCKHSIPHTRFNSQYTDIHLRFRKVFQIGQVLSSSFPKQQQASEEDDGLWVVWVLVRGRRSSHQRFSGSLKKTEEYPMASRSSSFGVFFLPLSFLVTTWSLFDLVRSTAREDRSPAPSPRAIQSYVDREHNSRKMGHVRLYHTALKKRSACELPRVQRTQFIKAENSVKGRKNDTK